jgi:hypothetical protein
MPARFDGNGWAPISNAAPAPAQAADARAQFWGEWFEVRSALTEWQLDTSSLPLPMCNDASTAELNRLDLGHISESFRHSALLYTERLAHPHLPSSAENFQRLVSQALYHITNVRSDVFLLWPMFITGTECVEEEHRNVIRGRCLAIQNDSGFFNNISSLELLEQVWLENGRMGDGGVETTDGGFRWRKAMEGVDGEYIVI